MGDYLAKKRDYHFVCSSSLNHPDECGFPKTFDARKLLRAARDHALLKNAVQVKSLTFGNAADTIRKAVIEYLKKGYLYPLTLKLEVLHGTDRDGVLLFEDPNQLDAFLKGIEFSEQSLHASLSPETEPDMCAKHNVRRTGLGCVYCLHGEVDTP